jgi:hypothetical protein
VLDLVASPGTLGHEAQETLSHARGVSRPAAVACEEQAKAALEVGIEGTCLFGEFLQGRGLQMLERPLASTQSAALTQVKPVR